MRTFDYIGNILFLGARELNFHRLIESILCPEYPMDVKS